MHRTPDPEPTATGTSKPGWKLSCSQGSYWAPHQASWWYFRPLHTGNWANDVSRLLLPLKNLWINRQKRAKFWRPEFSSSISLEYTMGFIESQAHQGIYWVTGTPLKTKSFLPVTLQQCFCSAQKWGVLTPQAAIRYKAMTEEYHAVKSRELKFCLKKYLEKTPALFTADRHSVEKRDRQREFFPEISVRFRVWAETSVQENTLKWI